jgi:N-acetylglucosamine-6-phosphate deacetylase
MPAQDLCALHYASRQPVRISWNDGKIVSLHPCANAPADRWLAPALVDLQINGYGGVDFQSDDIGAADLIHATDLLARDGCARFFVTFITDHWPRMIARLKRLRAWREADPRLKSRIAGWHFEGPFMSDVPGFVGTHDPDKMCDPKPELIRELRTTAGNDPLLLTVAPERAGIVDAINLATSLDIRVSMGHTNAGAARLESAVRAGACSFTHLGNGCPQTLDRHDNILWRIFETDKLTVGVIADAMHVSPSLFRIMHRQLGERIYYTTDAVAPAGMPPGRYRLGAYELEVGDDRVVRQPGKSNFAGSALRPVEGVFRAAAMLGCPWQETWTRMSQKPADFMRLGDLLAAGAPAHFCVLDKPDSGNGAVTTYIGGNRHAQVPANQWISQDALFQG